MFESFEDALGMIGIYAVVGFCLAILYNFFRFFRLAFPKMKKSAIAADLIFALFAGFVLFAFSVEYGIGFFRLYYIVSAAFGFALNMVTLGMPIPFFARHFGRFCGYIAKISVKPIKFICAKATYCLHELRKNISKIAEKLKKSLKIRRKMVYNVKDNKVDKVYPKGGENRNAIKAKVRKIV